MPIKTTDQEIGARPLTPIFFLVDTSGSMINDPIEAVNAAMRQAIPEIKNFARKMQILLFWLMCLNLARVSNGCQRSRLTLRISTGMT